MVVPSRFCVFWITNTIKNVRTDVALLMMSCHTPNVSTLSGLPISWRLCVEVVPHSRTRDGRPGIIRERVKGRTGTRTHLTDFPFAWPGNMPSWCQYSHRSRALFLGKHMPNPLHRAQRCHDLAEGCRAIALCSTHLAPC